MSVKHSRGWLAAALIVSVVALTGCSGTAVSVRVDPFDLHDTTKIQSLSCDQLALVKGKVEGIKGVTAPGEVSSFQRDWGINPQDASAMTAVDKAIADARTEKKCDSTSTPTPSATPVSTPTPSATPTATAATPSSTPSADPGTPKDEDFIVPAHDEDIRAAEFNAFVARCGNKLWTAKKAKDDKTDYVVYGKGNAYSSWSQYTCLIAHYPTLGHSIVKALVNQKVPSGSTFGKVNPWMSDMLAKSKGSLAEAWGLKDTRTGELTVTPEYQRYAFKIVSLLELFDRMGKTTATASWHYPALPKADGLRKTYKETKGYTGTFIPLAYTLKGRSCPFAVYGINVKDGRFAKLAWSCGTPRTPGNPGTPGTPHKPKPKPTPTPTPMPSKKSAPPVSGQPSAPPTTEPPSPRP